MRFSRDTPKLKVMKNDPDDDKFIECAVALQAEYIISGDQALLAVERYMNIKIVSSREFLELVKQN